LNIYVSKNIPFNQGAGLFKLCFKLVSIVMFWVDLFQSMCDTCNYLKYCIYNQEYQLRIFEKDKLHVYIEP